MFPLRETGDSPLTREPLIAPVTRSNLLSAVTLQVPLNVIDLNLFTTLSLTKATSISDQSTTAPRLVRSVILSSISFVGSTPSAAAKRLTKQNQLVCGELLILGKISNSPHTRMLVTHD
jgi:hypothetical protein